MQLSENFTLDDLTASNKAARYGFGEQFNPPPLIITRLQRLCVNVLEPTRALWGSDIRVSSGYRCHRLNNSIPGESKISEHPQGYAADIHTLSGSNYDLMRAIIDSSIPFDRIIWEFTDGTHGPAWVHISHRLKDNRRLALRAGSLGTTTVYTEIKTRGVL